MLCRDVAFGLICIVGCGFICLALFWAFCDACWGFVVFAACCLLDFVVINL